MKRLAILAIAASLLLPCCAPHDPAKEKFLGLGPLSIGRKTQTFTPTP